MNSPVAGSEFAAGGPAGIFQYTEEKYVRDDDARP